MITFFKDDMHRDVYTESFLNDTRYYDSLCNIYNTIGFIIKQYNETMKIDNRNIFNTMDMWKIYSSSRKYKCSPIEEFFSINDEKITQKFTHANKKYNIPSFGDEKLFINLYDIQKNIRKAGVVTISKEQLCKENFYNKVYIGTYSKNRYVIKLVDGDKTSRFIVVKFENSLGIFDVITYRMVAYKNFKTHKEYGAWNALIEKYSTIIYNTATKLKAIELKKNNIGINDREQPKKDDNYKIKSINMLNSSLDKIASSHKVNSIRIKQLANKDINNQDIKILNQCIKENRLEEFEEMAKKIYAKAFIRLVNYKEINSDNISDDADNFYYKLTGKRIKHHKNVINIRDREYRQPIKRGILMNSRGDIIDGGDNRSGQTQINIKMNDNDFYRLCNTFGIINPNQSELNNIVEQVLKQKFDSNKQFSLSEGARLAVLYHRDKCQQSKINNYKACYIPCEYNAYITEIQKRNYQTANFKNSKTFVLSVILHEFIEYI